MLFNDLLEAWIDELLPEIGFAGYIGKLRLGLPTVHLEADFRSVSRMGDDVVLSLEVVRVGGRSLTLSLACTGLDGVLRMRVTQVVVSTSLETHRAIVLPAMLREAFEAGASPDEERSAS